MLADAPHLATLANIAAGLREGAHLLYLVCHGKQTEQGTTLHLVGNDGNAAPITGEALETAIKGLESQRRPLLVVLVACESASQESTPLAAVGPLLARSGVPAVLAMQAPISMPAAARFTTRLLHTLARDGRIAPALAAARKELGNEWWVPALWLRGERLWEQTKKSSQEADPPFITTPGLYPPCPQRVSHMAVAADLRVRLQAVMTRRSASIVLLDSPPGYGKHALVQALPSEERARVLAQLGLAPQASPVVDLRAAQLGDTKLGDVAGCDVRKGTEGSVALSDDARINGVAVGVNLGTIIYGRDPSEDERRRLAWYLASLANKLSRLPLRGLEERLDQGEGMTLSQIYIALAVREKVELARTAPDQPFPYFCDGQVPSKNLKPGEMYDQLLDAYQADHALPDTAVIGMEWVVQNVADQFVEQWFVLYRRLLASEAITQHQRPCATRPGRWPGVASTKLALRPIYMDGRKIIACCRSSCPYAP